jgi:plastocyanin domain-containing protein
MNKTVLAIITVGLIVALGIVFSGESNSEFKQKVEIKDGVQYVTINAKGGYFPKVSTAKAGIPTKLIIKTDDTFDCSAALVVRSVGFQNILPQTGETEIDLGIPKAGEPLEGVCGMGMYSFKVNFEI